MEHLFINNKVCNFSMLEPEAWYCLSLAHSMLSILQDPHKNSAAKETTMKSIFSHSAVTVLLTAGSAFAGTGAAAGENGWLWMLFLGFAALIVVFQLVPSVILLGAMLKGLFSTKESPTVSGTGATKGS
jgi:hypothetical protein